MDPDFIMNGQGFGSIANVLAQPSFNVNMLRPFIGDDGRSYVTVPKRGADGKIKYTAVPTANANATLRRLEWIHLDEAVMEVSRQRLQAVADLRGMGLT